MYVHTNVCIYFSPIHIYICAEQTTLIHMYVCMYTPPLKTKTNSCS